MIKAISRYLPGYLSTLVYMLQSTEYDGKAYFAWYRRISDFRKVMYRRKLHKTKPARLLLFALQLQSLFQLGAGLYLAYLGNSQANLYYSVLALILILSYPYVSAYVIMLPLTLGRILIANPKNKNLIKQSEKIFASHQGLIIAVAGSYGKTSMKEILNTVLSTGKKVAATPANKNVSTSHAYFARKLSGDEDVLIIEYGEGAPGDVTKFAQVTHPELAVITGLAPAHLDHYPSLKAAGDDIFSVADFVDKNKVYVNAESIAAKDFIKPVYKTYSRDSACGWEISDIKVGFEGTKFTMQKGKTTLKLHSQLIGEHHVGPLAFAASLAKDLGLSDQQVVEGVSQTKPFEHRMVARAVHGAWIIDDTYNGNIDGMKAGLDLLAKLPGKRKVYVTPGLVDQGEENQRVHKELGQYIGERNPDQVVLMHNSTTQFILEGLDAVDYKGKIDIQHDPLHYYTNLEHFLAAGDVVMMQNDWPDNYN